MVRWMIQHCNKNNAHIYSSDGRENGASVSGAANSGMIQSRIIPMTVKLVFTASLLDAQH